MAVKKFAYVFGLSLSLLLTACQTTSPTSASVARSTIATLPPPPACFDLGYYTQDDFARTEQQLGVRFNHALLFAPAHNLSFSAIKKHLDAGRGVIQNITFPGEKPNLRDVTAGKYDADLTAFAAAVKADGRPIWVRPLHEANGDWYSWSVFVDKSLTPEDYRAAFRHVVQVLRSSGAPIRIQLDLNRYNYDGPSSKVPLAAFYPGDEYVDRVVITSYNRAYTDDRHQYWRTFAQEFDSAYRQVTAMTRKPIGIAEMSTTSYHGDKPAWIEDALRTIATRYPQVVELTWFGRNRPQPDGSIWDWALNTEADRAAFRRGVDALRTQRGCHGN